MASVVVVSGITSSLGEAIRRRFLREGFLVAGLSRSCAEYPCDVRVQRDCDAAISKIVGDMGSISAVVNCAGINENRLLLRSSGADFISLYETNVVGAMNLTRSAIKNGGMLKEKRGCFVHVGSIVGVDGNAGQTAYAASKAALIGASNSIAKEYASVNIRSNVLCPGLIEGTQMFLSLSQLQREEILKRTLLRRCASVDEVADAVFFLSSNSYVNAQALALDGGRS